MKSVELVRRRRPDGMLVLEAVPVTLLARLRRALRRLRTGA